MRYFATILTVVLLFGADTAWAQTGRITGTVTDAISGDPLPGANVAIPSRQLGTTTDGNGQYTLQAPAGTYQLQVSFVGFKTQQRSVTISSGGTATENFQLEEDFIGAGEVVVVGTRRADRTVVDSPVPVDVLTPADLQSSGMRETTQLLQLLVPSYNAPQASITDGSDHVRPATLRGLGPDQVLVLVNGKRRYTSALVHVNGSVGRGSTGTDLNAIPASAIERVEVLRDGAAAQYGSDAIAGVINIILKERRGLDASASYGQYISSEQRGYDPGEGLRSGEDASSFSWDDPGESGYVLTGGPADESFTDGESINAHLGYGFGVGDGGTFYVSGQYRHSEEVNRAGLDPRSQYYDGFQNDPNFDPEYTEQTFPRLNHRYGNGEFDDFSVFFNTSVPIADRSTRVYAFGGASAREGLSGCFYRRSLDNRTNRALYPDGFLPKINAKVNDLSLAGGLRGNISGWAWDLSETFGTNGFTFDMADTHNASMDNSPTGFDAGTLKFAQAVTNLDLFRTFSIGTAAPLSVAVGAEFRYENYQIDAGDELSYFDGGIPVRDGPNAGGSTAAGSQCFPGFQPPSEQDETRSNIGVYVDLENNLTDNFLVSAAGRFENYSDFGATATGKLAARLELTDALAVRGAVSTGFRAPSLAQAWFTSIATNFINGVPFEVGTFPVASNVARALGSIDLDPEKSLNVSGGVTFNQADVSLTVDGYFIAINDRITFTENFTSSGVASFLQSRGISATGGRYFTNALDTETTGLDVILRYGRRLGPGSARFTAAFNISDTKITNKEEFTVGGQTIEAIAAPAELQALGEPFLVGRERLGDYEEAQPNSKLNLQGNYDYQAWSFMLRTNRYGEVTDLSSDPTLDQTFSAKWLVDAEIGYRALSGLRIAVGANNLFDVYPDRNIKANSFNGIFQYNGFSPFGFFGRYVYTRVALQM